MELTLPTFGQLERDLSQKIQKLYREKLQCLPNKITCKLFDNYLAIVVEDMQTNIEKLLIANSDEGEIIKEMNSAINNVVKSELQTIVREILTVEVVETIFDSSFETKHAGGLIVLSQAPQARKRSSSYRRELNKPQDRQYSQNDFSPTERNLPVLITKPEPNISAIDDEQ